MERLAIELLLPATCWQQHSPRRSPAPARAADKYRFDMIIFRPLRFVQARLHLGRSRTETAILGITPS